MFQSSQRPAQGRKAVRTSTAPSLFSDSDKNSLQSESCMKDALDSRTADCRSPTFDLRGDSNHISRKLGVENIRRMRDRSLPSPVSREEVQSIYSVHQHLKNTIIQFKDPAKQGCCPSPTRVKRRKEVIRCWSRERIIRNETIISIRPPTSPKPALEHKNESNEENLHKSRLTASTSNFRTFPSEMSANQSESSVSLPSSLRYIPVQIIDDNQANNTKTTVSSSISDKCQQNNLPDKTSWIKSSNKDISNKRLNLSISNLEYAEYKDDDLRLSANNFDPQMHRNPGYVYNFASLYSQNSKFSDSTRRGTQGGDKSNTIIMQRNEVRRTSPPMDKKQNSTPGDDEDDDDDENSSTSRYSTADSSPVEETGPDINKKLEVKDDVMDNQTSNNNYDKQKNEFEKSPQNLKVDHQNLTRPTMNRQSVTLEFRTIVQRDEYGYGFRVCGNKPVSVHNVRKDGNAEKAGLKAGDQIIEVNGVMAIELNHEEVVDLIRSKSKVCLRLRRLRYQVVDTLTGYRIGSMRNLTGNEAPILRSQQRYHYQKRRSVRESVTTGSTASAAVKRRPRLGTQTFKMARSCSPPPSVSGDLLNDSVGPHTDEDIDWSREDETNLEPNPASSPQASHPNAANLPPTSRMVRPRSSIGPNDRTNKERPVSSGPDMFGLFKRSSVKDVSHPERVKEEESPLDELPPNHSSNNNNNNGSSSSSKSSSRMSFSGQSKFDNTSDKKATGSNLKETLNQSTFSSSLPPSGHVMGRNFDDEGDSDLSNANDLAHLSSEFDSATSVLASPAKCGMFIDYLFSHKRDPTWVLFYLVNQYFQRSMAASKELYKDEKRVCLEIFTTFLHEKSPLRLDIRTPISLKSFDFHECSKLFNTISQTCLNQIQTQVSKLAEAINLGMDTWCLSEPIDFLLFHNKEEEIACFESRLSGYLDSLYQLAIGNCTENSVAYSICRLPTTTSSSSSSLSVTSEQIAQAITSCLVTAHKYYSMPRLTSADYPETRDTGHSIRHSIFARSFENLTSSALGNAVGLGNVSGSIGTGLSSAGSNLWTKLTPYCAKAKQKSHSLLNRKTKWSHKGHSFYEYSYERIAECGVCGFLLWGLNLQGFNCNNCDLFVHLKCKNGIRDQCSREGRRTGGVSVNVLNGILGSIPNLTVDTNTSGNNMNQTNEAYNKLSLPIAHIGQNDVIYHSFTTHRRCGSDSRPKKKKANTMRDFNLLPSFLHRNYATSADHHPHEVMPATDDTANSSAHDSSNSGLMETSSVVTNNCCPGNASVGYLSPGLSQRDSFSSTLISSTSTSVGGNSAVQSPSESSGQTSGQFDKQRLSGEESGLSMNDPRHVKQMKSLYEGNDVVQETTPNPRSDSVASNAPSSSTLPLSSTLSFDRPFDMPPPPAVPPPLPPTSQPCTSSPISNVNETVRELVSTDWSDDPEMIASASFEAAVELRAQFPNFQMPSKGQKSEEYIRTLVLLEFHQKTQYMVRHLKQYEYLLLRRWPPEHTKVAKILCLDQIPILINLFRSLVTCIDQTKTDQGYCGMAEAVLAWLTDNSSANLKTWARHCQALSCSNMLDTVRHAVRDYVRRHPDIVPLLQTRHNKFVLIEGLKQMRILYFNLPLIANNIAKDLEKKTKMYKAEAKIWQQIQLKLASLPQTIDNVCMPLVKRINQGQLCTSLDKKDILSKPLPDLLLPFQHLLLNFPRVLFHHWVVAHAEVTVDKLTANRSNKVNHDYICERTDMLAILLHDALILLVKDSERYILRGFKAVREQGGCGGGGGSSSSSSNNNSNSSGAGVGSGAERASSFGSPSSLTEKDRMSLGNVSGHSSVSSTSSLSSAIPSAANVQSHTSLVSAAANAAVTSMTDRSSASGSSKLVPIFPLIDVFTSCGEKFGGDHLLNIVFMKQTVLIRLLFSKEDERQKWAAHIQENSVTTQSIDRQRVLKPTTPSASTQSQPSIDLPSESLIPKSSDITPVVNEATTVVTPQPSTEDLKTSFNMLSTAEPTSTELLANEDKSIIQLNGGKNSNGICSPEESTVFVDKLQTAMNGLLDQTQRVICEKYNISNEELLSVMRETDGNVEDISNPGKILLFQIKYFAKCFTLITRTLAPQTSSSLLDQIKNQIESVNNEDYQQFEALIRQKKRQSSLSWTEGYLDSLSRSPVLFNENNTVTSVLTSSSSASSSSSSKVPPAYYATDSQTDNPVVKVTTPSTHSSPNLFTSDNERNRIEVQDRRKSKRRSIKSETSPVLTSNFTFLDHLLDKELVTMAPLFAKSVMCLCKLTHQDFSYSSCLKQSVSQKTILSRSSVQIDSEMHWTESNTSGTGSTEDGEDEEVKTLANSIIDLSGSRPCDTMNYTLPSVEQSDTINTDFEFPTNEILESSENDIHEVARQIVSDALENAKNFISNMKPDGDEPKTLNVVRDSGCAPSATDDDEEEEEEEAEGDYNDNYRGNHHKIVEETSESHTVDNDEISTPVYFSSSEIMTPRSLSIPSHVLDDDPLDQTIISDNAPSLNDDLFITNGAIDAILQHQTVGSSPPPDSVASGTTNIGRNDSQKSTTSSGYVDSGDD